MRYIKGKAKVVLKALKAKRTEAFNELAAYTEKEPKRDHTFLKECVGLAKQDVRNHCKRSVSK